MRCFTSLSRTAFDENFPGLIGAEEESRTVGGFLEERAGEAHGADDASIEEASLEQPGPQGESHREFVGAGVGHTVISTQDDIICPRLTEIAASQDHHAIRQ